MRSKLIALARGGVLLALVFGLAVPAVTYAGKTNEDDPSKGRKEDETTDAARSTRDDHQTTGQVLEINTLKDPPEMIIANRDGKVTVHLLTKDLIEKNAVRLGDHVTVVGEKVSEIEFEAQEMAVDGHLGDELDNDE